MCVCGWGRHVFFVVMDAFQSEASATTLTYLTEREHTSSSFHYILMSIYLCVCVWKQML